MRFIFIILAIMIPLVAAEALDPQWAIDDGKKKCAEFFMGDICTDCVLPEGWEAVQECPDDYDIVKEEPDCTPRKEDYCCTLGHSGSDGSCKDVVVDQLNRRCGFVENMSECASIPMPWDQTPNTQSWGKLCPSIDYTWVEGYIDCEKKSVEEMAAEVQQSKKKKPSNSVWMIVALVLLVCSLIWVIYVVKLKNYSSI